MGRWLIDGETVSGFSRDASDIDYDNTGTGLQSTDVQGAITEINSNLSDKIKVVSVTFQYYTSARWQILTPNTVQYVICSANKEFLITGVQGSQFYLYTINSSGTIAQVDPTQYAPLNEISIDCLCVMNQSAR